MPRTEYSFTLPLGFAVGEGSTTVAGATAPLPSGTAPLLGPPAPHAGSPAPPTGPPVSLAGESTPAIAARAPIAQASAPSGEGAWPGGLPIGLRQDQERTRSREALMRSGAPPRRGRIEEGPAQDALSRLSPRPPGVATLAPADTAALRPSDAGPSRPPDTTALGAAPLPAESPQPSRAPDMEELCEELIARLRRELLVERERMGTLFGA